MARTPLTDPYKQLADILSKMKGRTQARLMRDLEQRDAIAAEKVRALMFTFDDLVRIEDKGVPVLLREIDRENLALALKGAPEGVWSLFLGGLSERAGKSLREDVAAAGPVRRAEVDAARAAIVATARSLVDSGAILIRGDDDEYVT